MSEAPTYYSDHNLVPPIFLEENEEIERLVKAPYIGSMVLPSDQYVKAIRAAAKYSTEVVVAAVNRHLPTNTWNENVCIAQGTVQEKTITLADEKSVDVKLPPNDSDTIRRLFVSLDEDDEYSDESDSASEELIRLIESLGKPAIDFLGKLIEDSVSYTDAFLGLELLGFIEQKSTLSDRVEIALRMLGNQRAPVRHAAIGVLAALRAEEALVSLESLANADLSTLNRKLAQRAIEKIQALP